MAIKQSYSFSNGEYFTHFWGTFTPSRMGPSRSSSHSLTPSAASEACAVLQLFTSDAVNSCIVVDLRVGNGFFPRDLPFSARCRTASNRESQRFAAPPRDDARLPRRRDAARPHASLSTCLLVLIQTLFWAK